MKKYVKLIFFRSEKDFIIISKNLVNGINESNTGFNLQCCF